MALKLRRREAERAVFGGKGVRGVLADEDDVARPDFVQDLDRRRPVGRFSGGGDPGSHQYSFP